MVKHGDNFTFNFTFKIVVTVTAFSKLVEWLTACKVCSNINDETHKELEATDTWCNLGQVQISVLTDKATAREREKKVPPLCKNWDYTEKLLGGEGSQFCFRLYQTLISVFTNFAI